MSYSAAEALVRELQRRKPVVPWCNQVSNRHSPRRELPRQVGERPDRAQQRRCCRIGRARELALGLAQIAFDLTQRPLPSIVILVTIRLGHCPVLPHQVMGTPIVPSERNAVVGCVTVALYANGWLKWPTRPFTDARRR